MGHSSRMIRAPYARWIIKRGAVRFSSSNEPTVEASVLDRTQKTACLGQTAVIFRGRNGAYSVIHDTTHPE